LTEPIPAIPATVVPSAAADGRPGPEIPAAQPAPPTAADRLDRLVALGAEHEQAGRLDEAERVLSQVLAEAPDRFGAAHLLGIVLFKKDRIDEAARLMERSIALAPNNALFYRNICEVYRILGRYDDALAAGRRAATLAPNDPHCHHNLGVLHYHRLELEAAIAAAERALALEPGLAGAHFGIAEASLLRGDFKRGWEEYEWRFRLANAPQLMPPTDKPQWDGRPLPDETLLLIADQGYGDVIQFARYIPWAAKRCGSTAVACSAELIPVISQIAGVGTIFTHLERQPNFAAFIPLSGLPRLAGTDIDTIPREPMPYLRAPAEKIDHWADRLDTLVPRGTTRIGIAWAGRPTHHNDRNRSTSLSTFAPLTELPGVTLLSLQKGPGQAQIGQYWGKAPLLSLGPEIRDFGDTMAIIDRLDMIVTVDTSLGHLAAAMAKPVWTMLPYAPDWRWLLDRTDSPWYPTLRLFRQAKPREWEPVMEKIVEDLTKAPPLPRRKAQRAAAR
jgi:Flp pilus assembly protein TadD